MVFYLGAALGKIGEAIQADSTERRAIRIRAEERAEDRTNLILDRALDIGTKDYYKRKQEAELKKSAIEKHMSQLALTGLDVDERFRIAQGGEGAVKDVMDRFVRWEGTFGNNSDTNLSFGDFYDIKKVADDYGKVSGQDFSGLSDKEFLDLFMPSKITFDTEMINNYLAQYNLSPTEAMLDVFGRYDQTETDKAIPTLGAITIKEDALKQALENPEKAKAYSGFEAAIVDTQTKINEINQKIKNTTDPEKIQSLNDELEIQKENMENYKLLQPTKGKGIAEVLGETSSQLAIEKSKDVSEQDKKLIAKLENQRDYLLGEKALIEAAGKTVPLNDVVANTTYQIDKLKNLEQTPEVVAKIEVLKTTQKRALESIQAIQDAKEKAKDKYKTTEPKRLFTNVKQAESFVANYVTGKLSADYVIFNDAQEKIALKFGRGVEAAQNYSHYFNAYENLILPELDRLVNDEKIDGIANPYYKDVDLTYVIEGHRKDFEQKVKNYFSEYSKVTDLKDKRNRLKHVKLDKNGQPLLFTSQNQVKAAASDGTITTGDFIYVQTSGGIEVPILWTGKNTYYITSNNELTTEVF